MKNKFKVCRQKGIGIYVIFACIVLKQRYVLLIAVYILDMSHGVEFDACEHEPITSLKVSIIKFIS